MNRTSQLHRWAGRTCALVALLILAQLGSHAQAPPLVLTFEPGWEGEIWQAMPKIGRHLPCAPDPDPGHPVSASCKASITAETFRFPMDVALYKNPGTNDPLGYRLYVADQVNQRVVVFVPDAGAADGDPNDGYGWSALNLTDAQWNDSAPLGTTGAGLSRVEQLAVDAAGFVYVTDLDNRRLVIFNQDGIFQRAVQIGFDVYGVDVRPGSTWGAAGTVAVIAGDQGDGVTRIVFVSTGGTTPQGQIIGTYQAPLDSTQNGSLIGSTGLAYDGPDRLVVADYSASRVKVFQTDASGVVQAPAVELLSFGRPTDYTNPSDADLQSPYAVTVDSMGRLIVSDTDNQRLAVYRPTYGTATSPGTAEFLFQLNASGGLNGFPRGMVEDNAGRWIVVDSANHEVEVFQRPSLAVVDVSVRGPRDSAPEVFRPDRYLLSGSYLDGDTVTVQFNVVAPQASGSVSNVIPTCAAQNVGSTGGLEPQRLSGPALIGWTNNPDGLSVGATQVTQLHSMADSPQDAYRFECTFLIQSEADIAFDLGASGNGGQTLAPKKAPLAAVGCAACETGLPTVNGVVTVPAQSSTFFRQPVTYTITAQDQVDLTQSDPRGASEPSGVKWIFWTWKSGYLAFEDPNFQECPLLPGTNIQCAEIAPAELTAAVDLAVYEAGYHILEYWAQDVAGNTTAHKRASFVFDFEAPSPRFSFPMPASCQATNDDELACWYNAPVTASANLFDNFTPTNQILVTGTAGPYTFSTEGANAPFQTTLTDAAGNSESYSTGDPEFNGRIVYIDRAAPTTAPSLSPGDYPTSALSISLTATDRDTSGGPGAGVDVENMFYSRSHNGVFVDGPLPYRGGQIELAGRGEWVVSAWSTDKAGNVEQPVLLTYYLAVPSVRNHVATTTEDGAPVTIDLLSGAVDPNGNTLTVSSVSGLSHPAAGTLTINGSSATFAPAPNFFTPTGAPVTFTYTVTDGTGGSRTATVTVHVTAVNDLPTVLNHVLTIAEDSAPLSFNLLTGAVDLDGDTLSVTLSAPLSPATAGALSVNAAGAMTFDSANDYASPPSATFSYVASDGYDGQATGSVTIVVTPVNDAPVAQPDSASSRAQIPVTINVLANDTDIDTPLASLRVTNVVAESGGSFGTMVISPDGRSIIYTQGALSTGTVVYRYTVSDGAQSATALVSIVSLNRAPVCGATVHATPSEIWPPNHKQIHNVTVGGVVDPDGDAVNITITGISQDEPTNTLGDGTTWIDGGLVNASTAWVRAERMGGENGRVYEISYTARDPQGGSCSGTVNLGVPHDQGKGPAVDSGCRWDSTVMNGPRLSCVIGGNTYSGVR